MERHTAIYVRVSTRQQRDRSQRDALERWIAAQNGIGPVKWYADEFTGKTMKRPGWARLEAAMRKGLVTRLVVYRLDRLGRTLSGLAALFDELQERGVGFASLTEGLDLGTPAGRLVAGVLASAAQYETEIRAERVKAGQQAARERGKRWGGSKKGRILKLTPQVLDAIKDGRQRGESKTALARLLGLSWPTVHEACRRLGV